MSAEFNLLDVVALTEDLTDPTLARGQVGTIVEELASGVFEVEFSDNQGRAYALASVRADQMMPLRYEPAQLAS